MSEFQRSRMLRDGGLYVFMATATKVAVAAVEVVNISLGIDRILFLNNWLYVSVIAKIW